MRVGRCVGDGVGRSVVGIGVGIVVGAADQAPGLGVQQQPAIGRQVPRPLDDEPLPTKHGVHTSPAHPARARTARLAVAAHEHVRRPERALGHRHVGLLADARHEVRLELGRRHAEPATLRHPLARVLRELPEAVARHLLHEDARVALRELARLQEVEVREARVGEESERADLRGESAQKGARARAGSASSATRPRPARTREPTRAPPA